LKEGKAAGIEEAIIEKAKASLKLLAASKR